VTSEATRWRVGVIGDPVAHSISPAMQQPALNALGIAATYERWHTSLAELPQRIAELRMPDVLGANVTVPHKQAVIPMLDQVSALAQRAGAVNTIINRNGTLFGDNTDVHGFATTLLETDPSAGKRRALILGAGGAARGVILALSSLGVTRIAVANRNRSTSGQLAADLAPIQLHLVDMAELDRALAEADLLVNATSLGWHRGESPIPLERLMQLPAGSLVGDLTYRDTDLLIEARACGLATFDGLGMLVHQGARAFELWTGRLAPVDIMMRAALKAREPRA
jgi:shikimate dehydrogenase